MGTQSPGSWAHPHPTAAPDSVESVDLEQWFSIPVIQESSEELLKNILLGTHLGYCDLTAMSWSSDRFSFRAQMFERAAMVKNSWLRAAPLRLAWASESRGRFLKRSGLGPTPGVLIL